MAIGLRFHYKRIDAALMAFRVANLIMDLGFEVDILPFGKVEVPLHPVWDKKVIEPQGDNLASWLGSNHSHLIYFGNPGSLEELDAAHKAQINTYLVFLWETITQDETRTFGMLDRLICPNRKSAKLLLDKLGPGDWNVHCIPWDPGAPLTQYSRELDPDRISVIWSLDNSQILYQDSKFVSIIETFLQKHKQMWLTITYNPAMSAAATKDFRKLTHNANGRAELVRNPSHEKHLLLYAKHDLTIWPSVVESACNAGLCSLYMGTPILAFDHPSIGEIIRDGKNGELVPCNLELNWMGVPYVSPDYLAFTKSLSGLLANPEKLSKMREWTSLGLTDRREKFIDSWTRLLSD